MQLGVLQAVFLFHEAWHICDSLKFLVLILLWQISCVEYIVLRYLWGCRLHTEIYVDVGWKHFDGYYLWIKMTPYPLFSPIIRIIITLFNPFCKGER
jgi:hypothetical protein